MTRRQDAQKHMEFSRLTGQTMLPDNIFDIISANTIKNCAINPEH